jgi:predicted RNase H-like HicB family nuclease
MPKDSRDLIQELQADGWRFVGATGSHHHFKHPVRAGKSDRPASEEGLASEGRAVGLSAGRSEGGPMSASSGYLALVYKDGDTSYGVAFPDVPGCISAGDTFEQAIDNAAEALGGHLALLRADGDPIPQPRSIEQLRDDPEFVADAADAVVAFVRPQAERAAAE